MSIDSAGRPASVTDNRPSRSSLVLLALVTGAIVANINLGIANVALPTIGRDLGATQDQLSNIADAFALGLASTVLYLGSVGDRYGRKLMFILGGLLTIPTSMMAAWAPNAQFLTMSRFLCGLSAALLFPTTLSLIGSLYRGGAQVKAIALWSGVGGGVAAVGPIIGGWLLENYWWGSVFLVTLPLDILALIVGFIVLPWHSSEQKFSIDHIGGILSVLGVGGLVLSIEKADQGLTPTLIASIVIALLALAGFFWRQTRAPRPLVVIPLAKARTFWVSFIAGSITFGSLIGAMFVGQQFTQNVLGYNTLTAAAVVLPAAVMTAIGGQLAGRVIAQFGSRVSYIIGLGAVALAFTVMLITWKAGTPVGWILGVYALVGTGVGFAATPASHCLMSSVPSSNAGMGSAFLDLTRDFGGAILQAVMGGLLATAYAASLTTAFAALPADQASQLSNDAADQITSSYAGAEQVASSYPQAPASEIMTAAAQAFTDGKSLAIGAGLALTLIGLLLVIVVFPRKARELAYYETIQQSA